jgi:iron complex outermembrane recepter protein
MKFYWQLLAYPFCAIALFGLSLTPPIKAEELRTTETKIETKDLQSSPISNPITEIPRVGDLEPVYTTIAPLLAQESTQSITQVTGVKITPTPTGVEVSLETTTGKISQPLIMNEGNTLIADIPNTTLALKEGNEFRSNNPVTGIDVITVTQQGANSIRVSIVGVGGIPTAKITPGSMGLLLSVTPVAEGQDENEIEVTVVGEQQQGYRVPTASTATKTDTPLRDIPQSIQIVPRQVIEDQGVTRVSDIVRNVSGVSSTTGPSGVGEEFTIRGFGSNGSFSNAVEFRNGFRALDLGSFNSSNIERVEVLKGPASVLYGQIEPGGLINFVTKQPLDRPYYSIESEIGSFSFYRPSLDISGALTDDKKLLYRLNASYESSGSFVDFVNRKIFQIAPSFTYAIAENTKLNFSYEYLSESGINNPGLPRNPIAFTLPRNLFLGEPGDTVDNRSQALNLELDHRLSTDWQLRSRFAWQSQSFQRKASRIGRTPDENGFVERFFQDDLVNSNESYTIQTDVIGKFKTGSIGHQLLFGIEWIRFNLLDDTGFATVAPINIFNPTYSGRPTVLDQGASTLSFRSDSISLYLQDQVTLLPNLKLLLGGRYDFINERSQSQDLDIDGRTPIGDVFKDTFSNQAFSPRVGIVYQPIEPISLYASYSTSFVPNNTLTRTGELIEPTRGSQFEVGIKTEFLDGKLAATLAAYQITKTNILTIDPVDPDFSIPIGEARSRGIEIDLAGEPLPGWNIITSFFVNESIITRGDENSPVGNRLINAPSTGASLWTTYQIQTGDLKGLGFGAGVFYVGGVEAELPNSFIIPSYVRTDATIFYKRDKWKIGLNFKNLFDTNYYSNQGGAIYRGDPFTILGSFSIEF